MIEFEGRKKIDTHLNITPLIDVVFQLLIFFVLSPHFVSVSGIKLNLPTAASAQQRAAQNILITITPENEIYLGNEEITLVSLAEKLKIRLDSLSKKEVVIQADEKVDLGLAVKVMDRARIAGSEELIIRTKGKDE